MIKISEFVNGYKLAKDKARYIEPHITAKYIPYEMKTAQAKQITDFAMYKKVNGKEVFWMNTPLQYQLFTQTIIKMYTDIDLADGADTSEDIGAILRGFNKLEESQAMSDIITAIGPDFQVMQTVLKMTADDAIANNSLISWLDTKYEAFNMVFKTFEDAVEQLKDIPKDSVGTET